MHIEAPIYNRLERYRNENRISFAMPGHKNMRGLGLDFTQCDVTELPKTLNLFGDDETSSRANKLLSELYGTKHSFILTCGSTVCIQAMVLSVLKHGDTLLISPDSHMSVINICAVLGVKIKLMRDLSDINDSIAAVFVTSPNYYGQTKEISAISEKCENMSIPLLVDEAHGAHFTGRFGLPHSAVGLGADLVCHSAHKTLNALTGSAYLHIASDKIDINAVKRAIRMVHTTSPSYMIAASADFARATLEQADYTEIIQECNEFKTAIEARTSITATDNQDPTRIVLNVSKTGHTGFSILARLSDEYGIDIEMADAINLVLIATPYNRHSDFVSLYTALKEIAGDSEGEGIYIPYPTFTDELINPSTAFYKTQTIDIRDAIGRVSASNICMYPPGCAVVLMGQTITDTAVKYIEAVSELGAEAVGISDGKIEVV